VGPRDRRRRGFGVYRPLGWWRITSSYLSGILEWSHNAGCGNRCEFYFRFRFRLSFCFLFPSIVVGGPTDFSVAQISTVDICLYISGTSAFPQNVTLIPWWKKGLPVEWSTCVFWTGRGGSLRFLRGAKAETWFAGGEGQPQILIRFSHFRQFTEASKFANSLPAITV